MVLYPPRLESCNCPHPDLAGQTTVVWFGGANNKSSVARSSFRPSEFRTPPTNARWVQMPSLLRGLRRSLLGPSDAPKGHCPICEELLQFAQAEGLTLLAHEIAMASKHAATSQCSTPCSWPRVPQQFLASKGQPDHGEWVNDGTFASAEDAALETARSPAARCWKLQSPQASY